MTNIPDGGGKNGHRIHDIGGFARTSRAARRQSTPGEAPASPATSSIHVSAHGERFVSLRARLEELPASRADRVERLQELIAAGRYQPDSEAIAAAMLADPATDAALGMP